MTTVVITITDETEDGMPAIGAEVFGVTQAEAQTLPEILAQAMMQHGQMVFQDAVKGVDEEENKSAIFVPDQKIFTGGR